MNKMDSRTFGKSRAAICLVSILNERPENVRHKVSKRISNLSKMIREICEKKLSRSLRQILIREIRFKASTPIEGANQLEMDLLRNVIETKIKREIPDQSSGELIHFEIWCRQRGYPKPINPFIRDINYKEYSAWIEKRKRKQLNIYGE